MNLDLNLLRVLDVLLEERSVTRAGARLGLTQSAVSHALNRLRYMLDDELFLRGSSGMQPTPRAVEMGPAGPRRASTSCRRRWRPPISIPATSERRFTVAAGAYACAVLVPPLVNMLAATSPMSELLIGELAADVIERIDARRVDFTISSVLAAPERFARETLLSEALAWVVRSDNPLAHRNQVDLEALVSVPHVVISAQCARGRSTTSTAATPLSTGRAGKTPARSNPRWRPMA